MLRILIVEDNSMQAESMRNTFERCFADAEAAIVGSEQEFISQFEAIARNPPDIIILDLMLRWSDPKPGERPPAKIQREGHYRAGLRCQERLARDKRTKAIPAIIYSIADGRELHLPPKVTYLGKSADDTKLVMLMKGLLEPKGALAEVQSDVFLVHGHDDSAKESVARFIERLGVRLIVLHEQANRGSTIIEKFERHSTVAFAVVLLTPDDIGAACNQQSNLRARARQNVIFELGFFVAKLGRRNVCALYGKDVEIPSDIQGVLYVPMDRAGAWKLSLAREMKAAGLRVDASRIL